MYNKFNNWFLNEDEIKFKNKLRTHKIKSKKLSLIQCPQDVEYLRVFEKIINDSSNNFEGVLPNYTYFKFWEFILFNSRLRVHQKVSIILHLYPRQCFNILLIFIKYFK